MRGTSLAIRLVMTTTTLTFRSPLRVLAVATLALPLAACSSHREEHTLVSSRRTVVEQQALPAPKMVDISIVNLHDEPSTDPSQERVVGTIVNDGDKRVSGLSIRVNQIDGSGTVIRSVTTPPLAQSIDPNGGRATFEAMMPSDPRAAGYHAVGIAR